jgi:excisionase family DNA binding protein
LSQSALPSILAFEPLLPPEQAAALLGIHPNTLLLWARQGRVPCIRVGTRRVTFRASILNRWLEESYTDKAVRAAQPERMAA